jgi:uncharacterized membrane protein
LISHQALPDAPSLDFMNLTYVSDLVAAVFSVGIIVGYHILLRLRVRRDPGYTIQALLNKGRSAWVERMMKDKEGILAVQTLRNAIMGATFFASTAVALIVGTITLSTQGDKLAEAWNTLSPVGAIDENLWLLKLLVLLTDMLVAFVCFAQAIRLFAHVGVMISVPTVTVRPHLVARLFIQGGRYHTRGMRCYYFAAPMLFWLFGPVLLMVSSCVLVIVLHFLDRSPARAAGGSADG